MNIIASRVYILATKDELYFILLFYLNDVYFYNIILQMKTVGELHFGL